MRRITFAMYVIAVIFNTVPALGQSEKRVGQICAKLTGDQECKVCTKASGQNWTCNSHQLWTEVPGTRYPLPASGSAAKPRRSGVGIESDPGSSRLRSCQWSPKWDKIQNRESLATLKQPGAVEQVASPSSCQQLLAMANDPNSLNQELQVVRQGQQNGLLTHGAQTWSANDYLLFRNGAIDICRCRAGETDGQMSFGPNTTLESGGSGEGQLEVDVPNLKVSPTHTKLVDEKDFAGSGSDSIDKAMEDMLGDNKAQTDSDKADLGNCTAALQYVAPGGGLDSDLSVVSNTLQAHSDGLDMIVHTKSDLLNDSWWAASKGPVIAAQIKYVTDEIQDWASVIDPEQAKLKQAQEALIHALDVAAAGIKAAYENRQNVLDAVRAGKEAAANKLAEIEKDKVQETIAEQLGAGPLYGTYKALRDQGEFIKTLNEAYEYKATVQERIEALDKQIRQLQGQIMIDSERQTALLSLRGSVIQACSQKSVPITLP